jgi:tryptophan-rich sensory protein
MIESEHKLTWWNSGYTWYAVILIVVVVILSIFFTLRETNPRGSSSTWYTNLTKPPGIPPDWVFSVVWSILYFLLLAGVIIAAWNYHKAGSYNIMCFYTFILLLTFLWCASFFGMHDIIFGAIVLVSLLIFTGIMIWMLYPTTFQNAREQQGESNTINWWDYLPFVFYILFGIWICCATYFNIGIGVVNGIN